MFPQSMHHFLHRWGPGPSDGDIPPPGAASVTAAGGGASGDDVDPRSSETAVGGGGEAAGLVVAPMTTGGDSDSDPSTAHHHPLRPLVGGDSDSTSTSPSTIVTGRNPLAFAWTRATAAVANAATVHHLRLLDAVRDYSSPGAVAGGSGLLSTIGARFQKLAAYDGRNGISATALGQYAPADPYDDEDVEGLLDSQAREISELKERVRRLEREVNEMEEGMENRHVVYGADDSFYRRLGVDEDEFEGGGSDGDGDDGGDDDVLDPDGPRARMRRQRRTIRILEGRVEYLLGLINLLEMIEEMEF